MKIITINKTEYDLDTLKGLKDLNAYILQTIPNKSELTKDFEFSNNSQLTQDFKDYISFKEGPRNTTRVLNIAQLKEKFPGLEIQGAEPTKLYDAANLLLTAIKSKIPQLEKAEAQIKEAQRRALEEAQRQALEKAKRQALEEAQSHLSSILPAEQQPSVDQQFQNQSAQNQPDLSSDQTSEEEPFEEKSDPKAAAQTALQLMVDAYNAAIVDSPDNNAKEAKFIEELKSKLGINRDAPKGFEKAAKDCFTDLRRIHNNKGSEQTLEVGDINPRTCGQPTRDLLVMVAQIILFPLGIARGLAAVGIINQERVDWMITDSSSRQSAVNHSTDFQKMIKEQKAHAVQVNQV